GMNFQSVLPAQPFYLKLTKWTCRDECSYNCMWKTVDAFINRNWNVPQFHGKWPFVRIFGIQEPASVLFSISTLLLILMILREFRKQSSQNKSHVLAMASVCTNMLKLLVLVDNFPH
ncbi:hypothetical protein L9F63_027876, partial [Diploptera punctata]